MMALSLLQSDVDGAYTGEDGEGWGRDESIAVNLGGDSCHVFEGISSSIDGCDEEGITTKGSLLRWVLELMLLCEKLRWTRIDNEPALDPCLGMQPVSVAGAIPSHPNTDAVLSGIVVDAEAEVEKDSERNGGDESDEDAGMECDAGIDPGVGVDADAKKREDDNGNAARGGGEGVLEGVILAIADAEEEIMVFLP
ncbi:hypothetical protein BGZ58_007469 [Dissophora ornata]|nr:hypothetical protein BGZ58_007469 [Dissophora ornata]